MAVKFLVFDLGNVLVEFKPADYLKRIGIPEADIQILVKLIFKDKRWNEFDRGTITIEDYTSALKNENPQYAKSIEEIFNGNWPEKFLRPKNATIEFLKEYSSMYGIYILSNVSKYVLDYVKTLGFFHLVSGGTYSYETGLCKPETEIYQTFFEENHLQPNECLFLDDLPANIEEACRNGMYGIVFHDNIEEVKNFLKMMN